MASVFLSQASRCGIDVEWNTWRQPPWGDRLCEKPGPTSFPGTWLSKHIEQHQSVMRHFWKARSATNCYLDKGTSRWLCIFLPEHRSRLFQSFWSNFCAKTSKPLVLFIYMPDNQSSSFWCSNKAKHWRIHDSNQQIHS